MSHARVVYASTDDDNTRWDDFAFRHGDIVISTRSKCGTTWMQMICALLIFQTPRLPATLSELSPWLDWTGAPLAEVRAALANQRHRRFIKTHTPLDGLPIDPRATYVVVARHPLDAAVSGYHQGLNIDRDRLRSLTGEPAPTEAPGPAPPLREWLLNWIDRDVSPHKELDSLPGMLAHLRGAWAVRSDPGQLLVHYDDLRTDLEGSMRALAVDLGIDVVEERWPALVAAASFAAMKARTEELVPDPGRIFRDRAAFFRRGGSGDGRELLTDDELAGYHRRCADLAPPALLSWLHR